MWRGVGRRGRVHATQDRHGCDKWGAHRTGLSAAELARENRQGDWGTVASAAERWAAAAAAPPAATAITSNPLSSDAKGLLSGPAGPAVFPLSRRAATAPPPPPPPPHRTRRAHEPAPLLQQRGCGRRSTRQLSRCRSNLHQLNPIGTLTVTFTQWRLRLAARR